MRGPLLVIVGPTAVGKTALSLSLAASFRGEIVSGDSMQVYRHMDIGTAKVSPEERERIPHHLIDIVDPDHPFSVEEINAWPGRRSRISSAEVACRSSWEEPASTFKR